MILRLRVVGRLLQRNASNRKVTFAEPPRSTRRGLILKGTIAVLGLGACAGAAVAYFDEGSRRSAHFWWNIFPIFLHYRGTQILGRLRDTPPEEMDANYSRLHDKYASKVEALTLELKGMYLKNAQFISTRDEFVPPQYMAFCKRVQNQVPTEFSPEEVRLVVEANYKCPLSEIFSEFDEKPLGAASIGQAHLARLRDGRQVVVKVMYPGIEHRFRSDLKTMRSFCQLAMPEHLAALDEMERMYLTEFNYLGEADNMQEIHDNMLRAFPREVSVPVPLRPLCSPSVLVMSFIEGPPLVEGLREGLKEYAERRGMAVEELEREEMLAIQEGRRAKRTLDEEHRQMQFFSLLQRTREFFFNSLRFLFNYSFALLLPSVSPLNYEWGRPVIDLGRIFAVLNSVHSHQMFIDGCFNGDPHPGNVLLCPDGKLGLIDYGQVKRVDRTTRINYARIICALAKGDREATLKIYDEIGLKTKHNNKDVIWAIVRFWNDSDEVLSETGKNVHVFLDWAHKVDPIIEMPQEYIMFARVSILLRGVGNAFGMKMSTAKLWEKKARELLEKEGVEV